MSTNKRTAFKQSFGLFTRPRFLILAHCALYLYCVSYTGEGNRKEPQKNAQSLKISPILRGIYNLILCPRSHPKPAQNHQKIAQKSRKAWGKSSSKSPEKYHQKTPIFPVALHPLRLHTTNIAHVLNLVIVALASRRNSGKISRFLDVFSVGMCCK